MLLIIVIVLALLGVFIGGPISVIRFILRTILTFLLKCWMGLVPALILALIVLCSKKTDRTAFLGKLILPVAVLLPLAYYMLPVHPIQLDSSDIEMVAWYDGYMNSVTATVFVPEAVEQCVKQANEATFRRAMAINPSQELYLNIIPSSPEAYIVFFDYDGNEVLYLCRWDDGKTVGIAEGREGKLKYRHYRTKDLLVNAAIQKNTDILRETELAKVPGLRDELFAGLRYENGVISYTAPQSADQLPQQLKVTVRLHCSENGGKYKYEYPLNKTAVSAGETVSAEFSENHMIAQAFFYVDYRGETIFSMEQIPIFPEYMWN